MGARLLGTVLAVAALAPITAYAQEPFGDRAARCVVAQNTHTKLESKKALEKYGAQCEQMASECPPPGSNAKQITEIRRENPEWDNLRDDDVVEVLRQVYYKTTPRESIACQIGVFLSPPPPPKPKLGPIDKWRYESCLERAANAPTTYGVNTATQLCKKRFDQ